MGHKGPAGWWHQDVRQHLIWAQGSPAVAGVELLQRQLTGVNAGLRTGRNRPVTCGRVGLGPHQPHPGTERQQQRHAVADGRAVGHVAAQCAGVAHRQPGKPAGKGGQHRSRGNECVKCVGQRGRRANGQPVAWCVSGRGGTAGEGGRRGLGGHLQQVGHPGHVQDVRWHLVLFGDPQTDVGAPRHQLGGGVLGPPLQESVQAQGLVIAGVRWM